MVHCLNLRTEIEMGPLLVQGHTHWEIGPALGISYVTSCSRTSISMTSSDADSRAEAVLAFQQTYDPAKFDLVW